MEGILQHIPYSTTTYPMQWGIGEMGGMDPILRAKSVSMPASQVGCTGKTDGKEKKGDPILSLSSSVRVPLYQLLSLKNKEQNIFAGKNWEYPVSKMKSTLTLPPFSPPRFFDVTAL